MCDFHSICIRIDGAIAHVPENSHSQAIAKFGWTENDDATKQRFWEAEWDGEGEWPGVESIVRERNGHKPAENVLRVAESHYRALIEALKNGVFDARFAADNFSDVRCRVAQNPSTAKDTLKVLAADANSDVRYCVAQNPSTAKDTLKVLAADANSSVRCRVAQNPSTAKDTLKVLAADANSSVRYYAEISLKRPEKPAKKSKAAA